MFLKTFMVGDLEVTVKTNSNIYDGASHNTVDVYLAGFNNHEPVASLSLPKVLADGGAGLHAGVMEYLQMLNSVQPGSSTVNVSELKIGIDQVLIEMVAAEKLVGDALKHNNAKMEVRECFNLYARAYQESTLHKEQGKGEWVKFTHSDVAEHLKDIQVKFGISDIDICQLINAVMYDRFKIYENLKTVDEIPLILEERVDEKLGRSSDASVGSADSSHSINSLVRYTTSKKNRDTFFEQSSKAPSQRMVSTHEPQILQDSAINGGAVFSILETRDGMEISKEKSYPLLKIEITDSFLEGASLNESYKSTEVSKLKHALKTNDAMALKIMDAALAIYQQKSFLPKRR